MKAVFLDSDGLDDLDLQPIEEVCASLRCYATTPPKLVAQRLKGAEIVIVNKVKIGRQLLLDNPEIQLICLVATGSDVIDLAAAAECGVTVCNCQAYGTDSVVQHVFSLILALHTNLLNYNTAVQEGRWQRAKQFCFLDYPIIEIRGKKLGIIGFGTLGRGVARIAEAFGMEVIPCQRPGGPVDDRPTLTEILPQVDVLTLHCPLTEWTQNIIGIKELARMKKTAVLINCARGGLVDESALLTVLQTGELRGAAIDVLSVEPPTHSNPLLEARLPNLIITPHIAWASREARHRIIEQTVENILAYRRQEPLRVVRAE